MRRTACWRGGYWSGTCGLSSCSTGDGISTSPSRGSSRTSVDIDQPTAALIRDLAQRGLLNETLVVFATEFGRTTFSQGKFGDPGMGRDHHGRCFSIWLAGGGVKPGIEGRGVAMGMQSLDSEDEGNAGAHAGVRREFDAHMAGEDLDAGGDRV